MLKRNLQRLDYEILHSTGERTIKSKSQSDVLVSSSINQLISPIIKMSTEKSISTKIAIQKVNDVIEESANYTVTDIDDSILQLKKLRLLLRENEISLQDEDPNHALLQPITETLDSIRDYVRHIKDCQGRMKLSKINNEPDTSTGKRDALLFAIKDAQRTINDLIKEFEQDTSHLTDEELIQIKSSMASRDNQIDRIAKKYQTILESSFTCPETTFDIKTMGERYELLIHVKSNFVDKPTSALDDRDVYKQKVFSSAKLNI